MGRALPRAVMQQRRLRLLLRVWRRSVLHPPWHGGPTDIPRYAIALASLTGWHRAYGRTAMLRRVLQFIAQWRQTASDAAWEAEARWQHQASSRMALSQWMRETQGALLGGLIAGLNRERARAALHSWRLRLREAMGCEYLLAAGRRVATQRFKQIRCSLLAHVWRRWLQGVHTPLRVRRREVVLTARLLVAALRRVVQQVRSMLVFTLVARWGQAATRGRSSAECAAMEAQCNRVVAQVCCSMGAGMLRRVIVVQRKIDLTRAMTSWVVRCEAARRLRSCMYPRNRTREIEARQIAMIVRRGTPPGQAGHCRKPGGAGSDSANVV